MAFVKRRSNDDSNNNGYKNRKDFQLTLKDLIYIGVVVASVVGGYYKLKSEIDLKPTKVEVEQLTKVSISLLYRLCHRLFRVWVDYR